MAKKKNPASDNATNKLADKSKKRIAVLMIVGAAIVILAARFTVSSASDIAYLLGMPPPSHRSENRGYRYVAA